MVNKQQKKNDEELSRSILARQHYTYPWLLWQNVVRIINISAHSMHRFRNENGNVTATMKSLFPAYS